MTAVRARAGAPGYVALEGGAARVEVVPAQGGRIRSLRLGGREWLLAGAPTDAPAADRSPLGGSGWDECAPAAGAGTVPEWVKGHGGRPVPAGGEARLQAPAVELRTLPEGHSLTCTWRGDRLPWTLVRTLLVRPDGVVEARYEATNTGAQRLPFLWSALLLLPLDARTHITFPEAARLRVQSVTGAPGAEPGTGGALQWPRLAIDGRARDLSQPWQLPRGVCVTGWVDLAGARATVQVRQGDATLAIASDGDGVPHCGIVADRAGTRDGAPRGLLSRRLPPALALRPSLGAPDTLAEALGDWQAVTWLAPGEPRRWTLTFRAS